MSGRTVSSDAHVLLPQSTDRIWGAKELMEFQGWAGCQSPAPGNRKGGVLVLPWSLAGGAVTRMK